MKDIINYYILNKMKFPITTETIDIDNDIELLKKKNIKHDEVMNRLDRRINNFFRKQKITY
jgi:hypothetical protein